MSYYIRFISALFTIMPINIPSAASTLFSQILRTRRQAVAFLLATIAWCVVQSPARVAAQDVRNTQNTVDSKKRSGAQVDPATGAMQLQIPLGEYQGRGGTSLPIVLSYSSKLWTMRYQNSSGSTKRYKAKYSEESTSGWTSSLDWFAPRNCSGNDCRPNDLRENWYDSNGKNLPDDTYHRRRVMRRRGYSILWTARACAMRRRRKHFSCRTDHAT